MGKPRKKPEVPGEVLSNLPGHANKYRMRVKELRHVKASTLVAHPENWRTHPEGQRNALTDLMAEIGFAGAVLVRELPGGKLQILDGHLRQSLADDDTIPVLVTDLTDDEATKLLLTYDPISAMAGIDRQHLESLLDQVQSESPNVQALLERMAKDAGLEMALDLTEPTGGGGAPPATQYEISVVCSGEADQKKLYDRLTGEGYTCRVLTL